MEIVIADDNILPAVREAFIRAFSDDTWGDVTPEDLRVFDNPEIHWIVAMDGQVVAGFMGYRIGDGDQISQEFDAPRHVLYGQKIGYEAELGVVPEYRRLKLSHALTRALAELFAQENIDQFLVHTKKGTKNYKRYSERLYFACECEDGRVFFTYPGAPLHLCPEEG